MPHSKKQRSTTIDNKHCLRYKALAEAQGKYGTMADLRRAAHTLYLDTYDIRKRIWAKYQNAGIQLSEVEIVRKLLCAEFYNKEFTIVIDDSYYSSAG